MARVGVVVNAHAGRVRRDPELVERLRRSLPARSLWVTEAPGQVEAALRELRSQDVDTLVLVGGDGSVHVALSALLRAWSGSELPALLLAGGGTINTIASSLGARDLPDAQLRRLLVHGPRAEDRRPALRLRTGDGEDRCGMVYAGGAAPRFLDLYYRSASRGSWSAGALLLRSMASVIVNGPLARALFAPFEARVRIDGDPYAEKEFTVIAAAAIRHIGLGFRPFFSAGTREDRFHFSMTRDGGRRIALELPWHRAGVRPARSCLTHASPARVQIETTDALPYTLDGDVLPPTKSVSIEATAPLRFLRA